MSKLQLQIAGSQNIMARSQKTIALITMFFLPATLFAVSNKISAFACLTEKRSHANPNNQFSFCLPSRCLTRTIPPRLSSVLKCGYIGLFTVCFTVLLFLCYFLSDFVSKLVSLISSRSSSLLRRMRRIQPVQPADVEEGKAKSG